MANFKVIEYIKKGLILFDAINFKLKTRVTILLFLLISILIPIETKKDVGIDIYYDTWRFVVYAVFLYLSLTIFIDFVVEIAKMFQRYRVKKKNDFNLVANKFTNKEMHILLDCYIYGFIEFREDKCLYRLIEKRVIVKKYLLPIRCNLYKLHRAAVQYVEKNDKYMDIIYDIRGAKAVASDIIRETLMKDKIIRIRYYTNSTKSREEFRDFQGAKDVKAAIKHYNKHQTIDFHEL